MRILASNLDKEKVEQELKRLEVDVAPKIKRWYKTICPHHLDELAEKIAKKEQITKEEAKQRLTKQVIENITDEKALKETDFGLIVDSVYHFWVRTLKCPQCGSDIPVHKRYVIAHVKDVMIAYCPLHNEIFEGPLVNNLVTCPIGSHKFDPEKGPIEDKLRGLT